MHNVGEYPKYSKMPSETTTQSSHKLLTYQTSTCQNFYLWFFSHTIKKKKKKTFSALSVMNLPDTKALSETSIIFDNINFRIFAIVLVTILKHYKDDLQVSYHFVPIIILLKIWIRNFELL